MIKTSQPALHGVQHLPDGSDPIPNFPAIPGAGTAYPDRIAAISAAHPGHLIGYWRLGEASPPFADSSGLSPPAPGAFHTPAGSPPLVTTDVTGALPPADDDGAVEFTGTTGGAEQAITVADPPPRKFNWGPSRPDITVACWVKPHASASSFGAHIVSSWAVEVSGPATHFGYALTLTWPTRVVGWARSDRNTSVGGSGLSAYVTSAALAADEWAFLVGTYSAAAGHQLYVNGSLVGTDSTVFATTNPVNNGLQFGYNQETGAAGFYGAVDEVSIWDIALTDIEIADLMTSGVGGALAAGLVWTSDGAGGASWELATIEVDY